MKYCKNCVYFYDRSYSLDGCLHPIGGKFLTEPIYGKRTEEGWLNVHIYRREVCGVEHPKYYKPTLWARLTLK